MRTRFYGIQDIECLFTLIQKKKKKKKKKKKEKKKKKKKAARDICTTIDKCNIMQNNGPAIK